MTGWHTNIKGGLCRPLQTATRALICLMLAGSILAPGHGSAGSRTPTIHSIGQQDAVFVADPSGKVFIAHNEDKKLIPASTFKVLTALVAIDYLGLDYRFPTDFFLDANSNLIVKGYGDPLLISEALSDIAQVLANKVGSIHDIVLDSSFFQRPVHIPGRSRSSQPYDAPNGALCANFNTVYFKYHQGSYVSAEPQTPLVPFVLDKIRSSGLKQERITFSQEQDDIPLYVGHLLRYFLEQKGLAVNGRIRMGLTHPHQDQLFYRYRSRFDLEQVIARMLEYSNNFIANQLLIAAGARAYSAPGTLPKGVLAAKAYAHHKLAIESLEIVEGSGISRKNRVSAAELDRILETFLPHHKLMHHEDGLFYKTGTLHGINTRVGYIEKHGVGLYRFVVMVNTPGKPIKTIMQQVLDSLP